MHALPGALTVDRHRVRVVGNDVGRDELVSPGGVALRVAALVAAIGFVAGGLALRSDTPSTVVGPGDPTPTTAVEPGQLTCDRVLASCDVLDAEVTTVASGDPAEVDLTAPYVGAAHVVNDALAAAARAGRTSTGDTVALATSPLVLVGRTDRIAALADLCGEPVEAGCAAGIVGDGWRGAYADLGRSSLAIAPIDDDPVTGLLVGAVVQADQDSLDTRALAASGPLLSSMSASTTTDRRTTGNRLTAMVSTPALTDFRVGLLVDWRAVEDLPRAAGLDAVGLDPAWGYDVVLWSPERAPAPTSWSDLLTADFLARGWDTAVGADGTATPTSPAGVWEAVHATWTTIR